MAQKNGTEQPTGVLPMTRRKTILVLGLGLGLAAGTAWAGHRHDDCAVPMTDWQPREAVAKMAEKNGWTVRRIKIDDGCYELIANDTKGNRIEAKVHPGTLEVVEIEIEPDHSDDTEGLEHEEREKEDD
jgi:hypothetical protein